MQASQPNLFLRDDNLLGVCQAIGDDFGFNPLWLRILFASALIWNPVYDISAYLALGAVVLLSRLIVPNPRARKAAAAPAGEAPVEAANANAQALPVAA
jgi:phage shock protein C